MDEAEPGDTLGDVIRKARLRQQLSLREVASQVGVTFAYIADIERDRRLPSEQTATSLARCLQLDLDELLARAGRLGAQAERYLQRHPAAGLLLRRIADRNLSTTQLEQLLAEVARLAGDAPAR